VPSLVKALNDESCDVRRAAAHSLSKCKAVELAELPRMVDTKLTV